MSLYKGEDLIAGIPDLSGYAQDSNVVHKNTDETIGGHKTFNNVIKIATSTNWYNFIEMTGTNHPYVTGYSNSNETALALCTYHNGSYYNIEIHNSGTGGYISIPTTNFYGSNGYAINTEWINNKFQVVSTLPANPDSNIYYFIPE